MLLVNDYYRVGTHMNDVCNIRPIFYGGEVLTPFGQRGSDGSYLTQSARRLNTRATRAPQTTYVAPQTRVSQNPATTTRSYSTPNTNNRVVYRRPFLGGWR